MEELIKILHFFYPLSPGLEAHLRSKIKLYRFRKGKKLAKEGEVASYIFFLKKGLIRSYSIIDGKKVSNYFMREGDIIISVVGFLRQAPAVDSIEALEDCECWGITWADLEETYQLFPEFNIHGRLIANEYYCRAEVRHYSQHRRTPQEKYAILMESDPGLLARVKDVHVASYLNVSKRTYAYIKDEYAKRKKR